MRLGASIAAPAVFACCTAFAAGLDAPTTAAPAPASTQSPWQGFYVGGHVGDAFARSAWSSNIGAPAGGTVSLPGSDKQFGPLSGGFQAGYNYILPGGFLAGVEADLSFPDELGSNLPLTGAGGATVLNDSVQIYGALRGRVGYALGNILLYGTAGYAYDRDRLDYADATGATDQTYFWRHGWAAGGGAEVLLPGNWSARAEFIYYDFAKGLATLPSVGNGYGSNLQVEMLRLGLNYRFGDFSGQPAAYAGPIADLDRWSLHAQSTVIGQAAFPFRSPYVGPQSLSPGFQARDTWSVTGYFGYKIVDGTEVYYNPEPFQGFGLSQTHGLANFPNDEAQKAGFDFPHYNTSRLFVRQTFGFGGEQEELADGQNQVASKVDVSRLTLTAGKLSVTDIFDNNAYAHDGRKGFLNWSLVDSGAFDYAADQKGYSWGVAAELNQKDWAVRTGYFLLPDVANSNNLDTRIGRRGQYLAEVEDRFSILSQPGKLRVTGWLSECYCGSFAATLANPALGLDITQTRQSRSEYGFIVNLEQALSKDFGVFSRIGWNSGQTEIMAWTDVNQSYSVGGVLNGTSWGRPDDAVGLAGIVSALSGSYRAFLAAGGLGINIGDGQLTNYQPETTLETYYSIALTKWAALTLDYQFVANPAYNADRGPVSIGSVRLHVEF